MWLTLLVSNYLCEKAIRRIFSFFFQTACFCLNVWWWSRPPLEKQVCLLCSSSPNPSHPRHMLPPLPQLIPIFWVPYGLAESWHGALRSAIILGVAPDHSPCLSHFIVYGNMDVPGNRRLDLFLSWLEPIAPHWHWHTLVDGKAAFQLEEVYWEGILSMCSQMMLFFCGCDSGQTVSVGTASCILWVCLSLLSTRCIRDQRAPLHYLTWDS